MFQLLRKEHPRLFRAVDDPYFRFEAPKDRVRKRILNRMIADCALYESQNPWKKIPLRPDSPYPYHQLYLTFYTGMDRFRHGVMPHGCGRDGEPGDGPGFWPWENLWMLQFADALRHGVGIDLYREFPERLDRPLTWFRYHWAAPRKIADHLYYPANSHVLTGSQLDACSPTLLRLAQEAGDGELFQAALRDPRLGRLYRFGAGVKGSSAECMVSYGPYAYCFYDPAFVPVQQKITLPLSRTFTKAHYGETGLLRSGWNADAVIVCVSGYKGGGAHGFCNVHIQWAGHPVLRTITAEEGQPVSCGSLPCVGNQNEVVAFLKGLETTPQCDRLSVRSIRTDHEYWLLHGQSPVLLLALRRKPRGVKVVREGDKTFARNGRDALQYDRVPYFNSRAGELRLAFRLNKPVDTRWPQVLFNTGFGVGKLMGTRVNTFTLGFLKDEALTFCVHSQRNTSVSVSIPKEKLYDSAPTPRKSA